MCATSKSRKATFHIRQGGHTRNTKRTKRRNGQEGQGKTGQEGQELLQEDGARITGPLVCRGEHSQGEVEIGAAPIRG
eukprot:2122665-Prymnesium_polylepis.2